MTVAAAAAGGMRKVGMFDYVDYKTKCPLCGGDVDGFQSKDGICTMGILWPHEVRNFHTGCRHCGGWLQCEYVPPEGKGIIRIDASSRFPKVVDGEEEKGRSVLKLEKWDPDDVPKNHKEPDDSPV